jgi:hypothetical protein
MARPPNPPEEQPVLVIKTAVRVYANEPELLAYFRQYKPGQYATAIKRAVRAGLLGGESALAGGFNLPMEEADGDDLDDFVG